MLSGPAGVLQRTGELGQPASCREGVPPLRPQFCFAKPAIAAYALEDLFPWLYPQT